MFKFKPQNGLVSMSFDNEAPLRGVCDTLHQLGALPDWENARQHDGECVLDSSPVGGLKYRIHFTGRGGGWLDIQSV